MVFQYKSLDTLVFEIRLMRIDPGEWDGEIRLSPWHALFDIDDGPAYEVLSYTWGDVSNKAFELS
jgi:hypothetical protein